nr:MAG TPA: hypothetical protein [Caudoviricetes sp.]DAT09231.1 MAG TPA: hypothetical protein [Caudoviricetes sp.]
MLDFILNFKIGCNNQSFILWFSKTITENIIFQNQFLTNF